MTSRLPASFRKSPVEERRAAIEALLGVRTTTFGSDPEMIELADVMVESAVGYFALPLGVAAGFVIDGEEYDVPMATEEPSVIAAAGYAASIVRRGSGFATEAGEPVTTGQLYVADPSPGAAERIHAERDTLRSEASPLLERMERRGGGWRGLDVAWLTESRTMRIQIHVDVRDAMGANVVNSVVEQLRGPVERITGGDVVMAILSNSADRRVTTARFSVPAGRLARGGHDGREIAERLVLANEIAREDHLRAVTHNKGIMNGVTALALATGNDTRALEATVHEYASRDGAYRALTRYRFDGDALSGELAIPVPLGVVGGAAGIHPASNAALALLGNPGAVDLARIAVCVGLAQNFAALFALVSEGIQRGHMGLHAHRLAWAAGARGRERERVVAAMRERSVYGVDIARDILAGIRGAAPDKDDSSTP
ncbi:MAG: hydroxymethylglutaryl-CoA reductase, degradative [Spirochaetota bacterium]